MTDEKHECPICPRDRVERLFLGQVLRGDKPPIPACKFQHRANKLIHDAMVRIQKRGERIDRVTLAHELLVHGKLEQAGGLVYIVGLDDEVEAFSL